MFGKGKVGPGFVVFIILVVLAVWLATYLNIAEAQYGHTWMKLSETLVTNSFGSTVKQCVWQCTLYGHGDHTTVTQGISAGFCPRP